MEAKIVAYIDSGLPGEGLLARDDHLNGQRHTPAGPLPAVSRTPLACLSPALGPVLARQSRAPLMWTWIGTQGSDRSAIFGGGHWICFLSIVRLSSSLSHVYEGGAGSGGAPRSGRPLYKRIKSHVPWWPALNRLWTMTAIAASRSSLSAMLEQPLPLADKTTVAPSLFSLPLPCRRWCTRIRLVYDW